LRTERAYFAAAEMRDRTERRDPGEK
jgi:hypothetical protein